MNISTNRYEFLCPSLYLLSIDYWIQGRKNVADNFLKKKLNVAYNKKINLQFHEASPNSDFSQMSDSIFIT